MKTTRSSSDTDHASSSSETSPDEARFKRANRRQVEMITLSLNQRLDVDHPVRAVWAFVEGLDLTELYGKIKAVKGKAGAAPIDPRILFALWIYATIRGIGSGRRIDELCHPHQGETAYQWICGGVSVNYHTINDFRTAHPECLDRCLTESVAVLMNEGLVSLDRIAQDGMRVRADASGKSFHRKPTLETCLSEAEEQVRLLRDESNNDSSGSTRPAFNVQFSTTADSRVIVGVEVTNSGSDSGLIGPMLDQVEDRFGVRPREALVDGGFVSVEGITAVEQQGTTVFAPIKEKQKKRDKGLDPFARVKGDTDEIAAWRTRMGTVEAQGIYQARPGIAEFSNAGCRNRGLYQFAVRGLEKVKCEVLWQVPAGVFQRGRNLRKLAAQGVIGG